MSQSAHARGDREIGTVLVVDDDASTREELKELISRAGFAVFGAADGAEALKILRRLGRCIVVLDLEMPKMAGEDFVVAALDFPNAVTRFPTVVLSGSERAPQAHRLPMVMEVFQKPVDGASLLRTLAELSGRRS